MKVIWKRPDGFHNATPNDYKVVEVSENVRIWLHKNDKDNYPFRVSGGWQDEDATQKLNRLVNLIPESSKDWVHFLTELFNDSSIESRDSFLQHEQTWLHDLAKNLKGDTWELEIMGETLKELGHRLSRFGKEFLKESSLKS